MVVKKIYKALLLASAAVLTVHGLAGCHRGRAAAQATTSETTAKGTEAMTAAATGAAPERTSEAEARTEDRQVYREAALSLLIDSNVALDGLKAVCDLAESELGITIEIEYKVDDSVLKTRLAAGEMTDLLVYNSGSLLRAMDPSEYLMDLTGQPFTDKYDDIYRRSVTVGGVVYGVPFASTQSGAVMYYKPIYEELGLKIPHTWDDFLANCQAVEQAGYTACLSSTASKSMTQVLFLGDHYNVMAFDHDFAARFESGEAGYASHRAGVFGIPGDDMQPYFDAGKTKVAMEFETAIKGAKCSSITQSLCLGELTAGEAAAAYDEDCRLQALQLGVLWD